MITVHHLEASRSTRVVWLLEELGVPYEIVRYQRDKQTFLAPPELAKIHPLGKSPVITDGARTVAESAVILEYLVETHGGERGAALVPARGTDAHHHYRYFMHYAEGSLMPNLVMKLVTTRVRSAKMPFFAKPIAKKIAGSIDGSFVDPNLAKHFAFLGAHLDGHPWIAGDSFSVADIQMSFPVIAAITRAKDLSIPKSLAAYADKLQQHAGYQRAVAKAGA